MTDTIFALASAQGRAAVAVMRLSGPGSGAALDALCRSRPPPRLASLRKVRDASGRLLDQALVLWFPGPASYTGEDCAELHLHGGPAIVGAVGQALAALGLRLAEPGEFTRRAFETGRLDLAQAEAVGDLIDAETAAQARQALAQLGGALGRRYETWRAGLIEALALLEAAVDFPDEEVPEAVADGAAAPLEGIRADLAQALADAGRGRRIRDGYRVAIVGAPNAGKSTLLNALAGREAAIVTATPGTTRDVIEVPLVLAGYKLLLADTAGLRDAVEEVEAEGVRRALVWAAEADLRLWVIDGSADEVALPPDLLRPGDLALINKADRPEGTAAIAAETTADAEGLESLRLVARQDASEVLAALQSRVVAALSASDFPAATRLRHEAALGEAAAHLDRALAELAGGREPELAAEDVRLAARSLARITGRIEPDQVLDRVFATFCIGK